MEEINIKICLKKIKQRLKKYEKNDHKVKK